MPMMLTYQRRIVFFREGVFVSAHCGLERELNAKLRELVHTRGALAEGDEQTAVRRVCKATGARVKIHEPTKNESAARAIFRLRQMRLFENWNSSGSYTEAAHV